MRVCVYEKNVANNFLSLLLLLKKLRFVRAALEREANKNTKQSFNWLIFDAYIHKSALNNVCLLKFVFLSCSLLLRTNLVEIVFLVLLAKRS
jgi:hypothetical protein